MGSDDSLFFIMMAFRWQQEGSNEWFYMNPVIDIVFAPFYSYLIFGFARWFLTLFDGLSYYSEEEALWFYYYPWRSLLKWKRVTPLLKRRIDKAVEAI